MFDDPFCYEYFSLNLGSDSNQIIIIERPKSISFQFKLITAGSILNKMSNPEQDDTTHPRVDKDQESDALIYPKIGRTSKDRYKGMDDKLRYYLDVRNGNLSDMENLKGLRLDEEKVLYRNNFGFQQANSCSKDFLVWLVGDSTTRNNLDLNSLKLKWYGLRLYHEGADIRRVVNLLTTHQLMEGLHRCFSNDKPSCRKTLKNFINENI